MHLNVEIKARCSDPERFREFLREEGADFRGLDVQTDTYFDIERGRLKLREGNIENALIFYEREDTATPKDSQVHLYQTEETAELRELLQAAVGIRVVVKKRREIYFVKNVKFHIDEVVELGHFVEIEAIDIDGTYSREELLRQCQYFIELLGINDDDLMTYSYSDMLLQLRRS